MDIINENTVVLTDHETRVQTKFEALLNRGYNIPQSIARIKELYSGMDPAFYRWLADQPLLPMATGNVIQFNDHFAAQLLYELTNEDNTDSVDGAAERLAQHLGYGTVINTQEAN